MVDKRCAIATTVLPCMSLSKLAWLAATTSESRALVASSTVHALVYASYVWLASKAGSVFASQCSYLVTASGVFWAMALLGERFSPLVWVALVLMLAGVALVQPRAAERAAA